MKRIILSLLSLLLVLGASAQSASTSPGTGHWVVIDSGYQVATAATGKTVAPLHFYNTSTSEKITGMQFRIKYDNTAFTEAIPSLKISSTDQYLQYVDDKTNGYLSITVVYTGTSSTFNYSNGATFDLTFTHASAAVWNTLDSIKSLKVVKVAGWNDLASTNFGNDTTLTVYSYGGRMNQKMLRFAGKFINVTGTNAKNLWVALEKKAPGGSWTQVEAKSTNSNGHVVFFKNIDTTYWDVRMTVKGDTMSIGNVLSTADAQKINQAVLGQYTPTGFDFYTMDVNGGDGVITIADAYSVFGRIAGRFTSWPNSKKDVMFFTAAQYASINGATSNPVATYGTTNNFEYYIDGKDSITYYVAVKGDANNTGFKMARLVPIKIINQANAKNYIIDNSVEYDFPTNTIEVNMPKVKVDEGNLVNIPVKVLTGGKSLGAFQLELKYDTALLEFRQVENTEKAMKWLSFFNPDNGTVSWGGVDMTNSNLFNDSEQIFTVQFVAKKPQDEWGSAAVWTGPKYVGDMISKDMSITPAMGVVEVRRIKSPVTVSELGSMLVFPNPNQGEVLIQFELKQDSYTELAVSDLVGRKLVDVINERMPKGEYKYLVNVSYLDNGFYLMSLKTDQSIQTSKIIINK